MHLRNWLFLSLTVLFLSACSTNQNLPQNNDATTNFEFIILQLNDVYEIAPLEGGKSGGLARVATLLKELEAENPNTIAVMAGDFLSPSFMANLKMDNGEKIAGLQMVETLNALGLDYATFGNHEFDLSDPVLVQKRIDASQFRYLTANVRQKHTDGSIQPFKQNIDGTMFTIPDFALHKMKNATGQELTLALVGTTLPFTKQPYLHYLDWDATFADASQRAQAVADIVIGLTHLDLDQDMQLAEKNHAIPLIMGGHEHDSKTRYVEQTIITKAFANARTVYVHRISYNPGTKMTQIRSSVVPIDDQIADETNTAAVVNKWQQKTADAIREMGYDADRVIYQTDVPLEATEVAVRSRQTNYGKLATRAYQFVLPGADVYLLNGGSIRVDDNLVGALTEYDILRSFPFGGGITTVEMQGSQVQQLLETGAVTNQGEGGYLQLLKAEKKGGQWQVNGKDLAPSQSYKIVMPSFVASGREANLGFLADLSATTEKGFNINGQTVKNDVRDIIIAYLSQIN